MNVVWERTNDRLRAPLGEAELRRQLGRLPDTTQEWIAVMRAAGGILYLSRVGRTFEVTFQDLQDRTWTVWKTPPGPDHAAERPDLDLAVAWALDFAASGTVHGTQRDSEEDRVRARGVRELLREELSEWLRDRPMRLVGLQLHLHRHRAEAAVSVLADDWRSSDRSPLARSTRQLQLAAHESPWAVKKTLLAIGIDVLRGLELEPPTLRVLVLDDLPVEHAIATTEVLHGTSATQAWRAAISHDVARLWTYRGELRGFAEASPTEPATKPAKPTQTGFDFD
ncbi:MAG: hypothetical protein H6722_11660 [Sandaracinus sp.]|nr:hypothetical protein [Sandaracinus sp.]MCB9613100.1 hypothetical protein [Sandaracinus sp.]